MLQNFYKYNIELPWQLLVPFTSRTKQEEEKK